MTQRTRRIGALAGASLAVATAAGARAMDLDLYQEILLRHTRAVADTAGTRVDYAALARDPAWKDLLAGLAAAPEPGSRDERLAFWINAYNVLAMDMVVRNRPLASIRDAGSLLRPVWKVPAGRAADRAVTLDEIEHRILRPMGEPRVHVAIVCASTSCPSLAREPFRAERLDAQLDAAARTFVTNPKKGARIEGGGVRISKIFSWFEGDFAAGGGVLAFVRRHATPDFAAALDALGPDPRISWFDYDWSLNGLGQDAP